MNSEDFYNPNGTNILDEKIYGSSPTGFLDFNRSKYKWAGSLYDLMQANTWFPSEVDVSNEKKNFASLTENEQNIYKLVFGQLSFNDSAQEEHLLDFRSLTSNRILKGTLTLQAMQEVNHSKSYAVLLSEAGNSNEVFDLYRTHTALNEKNAKIADQFGQTISGSSVDKMLLSSMASVNLEGIYFLLGFGYIYTLGDKVPAARDMIKFIARDELNTHLPLFANIFKTIRRENKIHHTTIDKAYEMIQTAVETELQFGKYLIDTHPIMGLTDELIVNTVHNYANDRLKKIGLDPIFSNSEETYLQKLVSKHLGVNEIKTNFFEGNNANYSKGSIDLDDF